MNTRKISTLIITDGSPWGGLALEYAQAAGLDAKHISWDHGVVPAPKGLEGWHGDWILSFKSDYILAESEIDQAKYGALNFHPAPPSLRGVGTYQIALDQKRSQYGVTCHHINKQIDAGPIVTTRYFDIAPTTTAPMLHQIASGHLFLLYTEIVRLMQAGDDLPSSAETWTGPLYTWKQWKLRSAQPVA